MTPTDTPPKLAPALAGAELYYKAEDGHVSFKDVLVRGPCFSVVSRGATPAQDRYVAFVPSDEDAKAITAYPVVLRELNNLYTLAMAREVCRLAAMDASLTNLQYVEAAHDVIPVVRANAALVQAGFVFRNMKETLEEVPDAAAQLGLFDLLQHMAAALRDHHEGTNTTRPFDVTYERDEKLLNRAAAVLVLSKL